MNVAIAVVSIGSGLLVAFMAWVVIASVYQTRVDKRQGTVGEAMATPMPPPRPTADDEWQVLAAARGWEYHSQGQDGWASMSAVTKAATMPGVQVANVLTGRVALPERGPERPPGHFMAFDLRPPVKAHVSEAERWANSRRVCAMRLPVAVPRVVVAKEFRAARPFNALTARWNVDVEHADFNRAFEVRTGDRRAASDLVHPLMMNALVAARPFLLAFEGDWLTWVEMDGPWDPAHLDRTLTHMAAMMAVFPTHLVPPTTQAPTTQAPTTQAPTTQLPTTQAPTTLA